MGVDFGGISPDYGTVRRPIKRVGYVEISYRLLEELLGLDDQHYIDSIWVDMDFAYNRRFKAVIIGPKMPEVPEGQMIPRVDVILEKRFLGVTAKPPKKPEERKPGGPYPLMV